MRSIGIVLVILGVIALVYGGISYNRQKTLIDVGLFKATTTEQKTLPLPPVLGGIALVGGIVLLVVSRRRPA